MTRTTYEQVPVDMARFQAQVQHLCWLRRLPMRRLRKYHREVFSTNGRAAKYYVKVPHWAPRYTIERRCWFWFCACNYHLPHPYKESFWKDADRVLREPIADDIERRQEDMLWSDLKTLREWLKDRTTEMEDKQAGRIISVLGYNIRMKLTPEQERQVLAELAEREDIATGFAKNMQQMVGHRLNKRSLRELVLEHPKMSWAEFQRRFGLEMPTVTQGSYYYTRSWLRTRKRNAAAGDRNLLGHSA